MCGYDNLFDLNSLSLFFHISMKTLEIRQSHFEKMNMKIMQRIDELKRMFVVVRQKLKTQKKLLKLFEKQKELFVSDCSQNCIHTHIHTQNNNEKRNRGGKC